MDSRKALPWDEKYARGEIRRPAYAIDDEDGEDEEAVQYKGEGEGPD